MEAETNQPNRVKKFSVCAFMANKKKSFNLIRWFSVLGLLVICLTSAISAAVLSRFLEKNVLRRDADVTMALIQSIADKEDVAAYFFKDGGEAQERVFVDFFEYIAQVPEIKRANIYSADRTIIWSSKKILTGEKTVFNPMLDRALNGKVGIEMHATNDPSERVSANSQYAKFANEINHFAENYIPIWNRDRTAIVGVMEVYKVTDELLETIASGTRLVWFGAALSGVFLFATLFWIVYHGNAIIHRQQKKLIETETLATIGEMSSSIAHNIRNPLASIRSSAELALGSRHRERLSESASEIIEEVDTLDRRIQDLLIYGKLKSGDKEVVHINQLIRLCVDDFALRMKRQNIRLTLDLFKSLPQLCGDVAQLRQVFDSIVTNAIEVMPLQGELIIRTRVVNGGHSSIQIEIIDTGPGISMGQSRKVFHPFISSKQRGMGLGLPLAKRFINQHGGSIELVSQPGEGTVVIIELPC